MKIKIALTGENTDALLVKQFCELLINKGQGQIDIVRQLGEEQLRVDISDLTQTDNLEEEVNFIIETAINAHNYEIERDRTIKQMNKQFKRKIDQKNIN